MSVQELLENPFIVVKRNVSSLLKSKSKPNIIIDLLTIVVFSCLFFSIPTFSFLNSFLHYLTWVLAALFLVLVVISIILFYYIQIDSVVISLFLFCLFLIISSALNGFNGFDLTYILLTAFIIVVYCYSRSNPRVSQLLINAAYIGSICFLFLFVIVYNKHLLIFNERLGGIFGDENDIAIFNCFCSTVSLYYVFKSKNLWIKIITAFIFLLSFYCGILSGSKIVILLGLILGLFLIIYCNGYKKWWISLIEISLFIVAFVFVLNLPFASELKHRLLSMINVFSNEQISGADSNDFSTTTRIFMFADGIDLFLRKPLLGYGVNGFSLYGGINKGWSHNHFSEMLCNTGILGFSLYHFPFIASFYSFLISKKKEQLLISFLLLLFFSISTISIALPAEKMFAFVIGAIYASLSQAKSFYSFSFVRRRQNENC